MNELALWKSIVNVTWLGNRLDDNRLKVEQVSVTEATRSKIRVKRKPNEL
jgi:hypothetical protein